STSTNTNMRLSMDFPMPGKSISCRCRLQRISEIFISMSLEEWGPLFHESGPTFLVVFAAEAVEDGVFAGLCAESTRHHDLFDRHFAGPMAERDQVANALHDVKCGGLIEHVVDHADAQCLLV